MDNHDLPILELGANLDPRSEAEQSRDFNHDEIVAATPVVEWKKKKFEELRRFPERFQSSSLSCMAQSGVKNLGIANYVITGKFPVLSALPVYRPRVNFPNGGMSLPDLFKKLTEPRACLEKDMPSQNLGEQAMNTNNTTLSAKELADAEAYKADGYVFLTLPLDIDQVAALIDAGKSIQLMMYFEGIEYWRPRPIILNSKLDLYANATLRHGIAGADRLLLEEEKTIYIEDSAGNSTGINGEGRRYLSETFLKARCFGAGYLIKKGFTPVPAPKYHFTKSLTYGMKNDPDVKILQAMLQHEQFFPTHIDGKAFEPTGNFKGMTADALKEWQIAHNILDFQFEKDMRNIRFGPKSIALANKLYA